MKLALILNAIVPTIGGVLIRGEKGTGKSTAVRALARLLPEHEVVEGCHFGCDPSDREALCADCRERLRAGAMLPHHKRRTRVVQPPMNPEEGELRPQLLDRFGLCVDVEGIRDPDERVLIAERDAAFQRGDHEFANEFAAADSNLSRALAEAIGRVKDVRVTGAHTRLISSICVEAEVLGHRADVVIDHAARALAAYRRHGSPSREDIYDAASLALAHRARQPVRRDQDENTSPQSGEEQEGSQPADSQAGEPQASDSEATSEATTEQTASSSETGQQSAGADTGVTTGGSSGHESSPDALETFNLRRIDLPRQRRVRKQGGKRAASQTPDRRGRYVRAEPKEKRSEEHTSELQSR